MCDFEGMIIRVISHSDSLYVDMTVTDNAPYIAAVVNDDALSHRSIYRHFRDLTVFRRYDTEGVHLR